MTECLFHFIDEREVENPDKFLSDCAYAWASNEEDPQLEGYRWELSDPADDEVEEDYEGPVRIVKESYFLRHYPVDYVRDEQGEVMVFDDRAAAQAWVDESEEGIYHLSHCEAGRPTYIIVKD